MLYILFDLSMHSPFIFYLQISLYFVIMLESFFVCVCDLAGLDELCPEEFVAHASTVNCLKIGRKSSRVLVTGGEDHKVNLWAIGKPNAILVRSFSSPHLWTRISLFLCIVFFVPFHISILFKANLHIKWSL